MEHSPMPNKLFVCPECGLSYRDAEWATKCEAWCKEHKSCNIEITTHSMETEQLQKFSKRERRELREQEKQKLQGSRERKRLIRKMTIWIIAALLIGGGGYGLYSLASQPEKARPGETFPILGQEHIDVGASHESVRLFVQTVENR